MKDSGAGTDAINDLIQLVVNAMPEASILKSTKNVLVSVATSTMPPLCLTV
jgi:hypothetical protein